MNNDEINRDSNQKSFAPEYQLIINDKQQLKNIYMPFINNGGIFIATEKDHELNSEVTATVKLFDNSEAFPVVGRVVWLNPKFVQGGRTQGVGIQFTNQEARRLQDKIENILAGFTGESAGVSETM